MIIDTHTHLYIDEFAGDEATAVKRAIDAGVGFMIFPNIDASTVEPMKRLHRAFPANTATAIGLHPTEVTDAPIDEQLFFVNQELAATGTHKIGSANELSTSDDYVAVGEIGIDLYWDKTYREQQMQVFERQLQMAAERSLPVIIHCREGLDETLEVIEGVKGVTGVFHSFGGTVADVEEVRQRAGDFYFGINGIVTFKNSKLRTVLPEITLDRILLETDSPYLAPVPHRGKRNESAFIIHTAAYVASTLNLSPEQVAKATTLNASRLFRLPLIQ